MDEDRLDLATQVGRVEWPVPTAPPGHEPSVGFRGEWRRLFRQYGVSAKGDPNFPGWMPSRCYGLEEKRNWKWAVVS